jgi:hypothetical protein
MEPLNCEAFGNQILVITFCLSLYLYPYPYLSFVQKVKKCFIEAKVERKEVSCKSKNSA